MFHSSQPLTVSGTFWIWKTSSYKLLKIKFYKNVLLNYSMYYDEYFNKQIVKQIKNYDFENETHE